MENNKEWGFEIYKKPYINLSFGFLNIIIRILLTIAISFCTTELIFETINIGFDYTYILKTVIITALICSFMYFNGFVALAMVIGSIFYFYNYVLEHKESIKYAILSIMNQGYDVVRNSLDLPYADGFEEVRYGDYTSDINSLIVLTAIVLTVLISYFIGKYMSAIFSTLGIVLLMSYCYFLENIVDYKPIFIILASYIVLIYLRFFTKGSFSFLSKFKVKRKNINKKGKDGSYITIMGLFSVLVSVIVLFTSNIFVGRTGFDTLVQPTDTNNYIKYAIRDVMVLKYAEYKDFVIPSNVDMGQLGFFSCVEPVFKNEFHITTQPIEEDKLYIKSFNGVNYNYRGNFWSTDVEETTVNINDKIAEALKNWGAEEYSIKFKNYSEKGFSDEIYLPYYTITNECSSYNVISDSVINGSEAEEYTVNVYKYNDITVDDSSYRDYIYRNYLGIDDENKEVIDNILNSNGINKDNISEETLKNYFSQNYTYDFDNGVLPYGKDFVNYFLTESKKGNFAHFASTAVLMYRSLGIPARYAGGYAIDQAQFYENRPNRLGETTVAVKSANMYAWVEVYKDGFGWIPVDVSPSFTIEEMEERYNTDENENALSEKYTDVLNDYFKPIENEYYNPMKIGNNIIKLIIYVFIALIIVLLSVIFGKKAIIKIKWYIKYSRADVSTKAYMLMEKLKLKLKADANCNYTELSEFALNKNVDKEVCELIKDTANKLVYSKNPSNEDLNNLKNIIKKLRCRK